MNSGSAWINRWSHAYVDSEGEQAQKGTDGKMNKDLHLYIEHLERKRPGEIIRIKKEVSPEFEIPAILQQIESRKKEPVLIFEKVRNLKGGISELPVVINLFGSRERLADVMGTTLQRLPLDYIAKEKPIPPVVVKKDLSRVKEVVQMGKDVDLFELPILTHHEMNLGPYLTGGSAWMRDPETGWTNCAVVRIYVSGPRNLVVNFNPARHSQYVFQKYKALGVSIPLIVVIGHHPAFYLGGQTKLLANEPEIIGGIMGEPLELTSSEFWQNEVLVPAQAELILEIELSTRTMAVEAPFGEFTQYYAGQKLNPVGEVKVVTRRKDAFYLDIMPGRADHLLLDAPMIEAYLYNRIKAVVPGVVSVHLPVSGAARLHAYVQIRKANDAEPKTVIATALSSDYRVKHVVVVDEDIDIYDDEQVLWAIATRSQWDKDLMVLPGMMGTRLDPSAEGVSSAKGGIDATKPLDAHSFPKRLSIPESVLTRIKLEDYLEPGVLEKI
jgi:2,5-furandicarboxylate decarboxylase 1